MRANQLRLWFASMAYVLMCALRRIGLAHTQFADATCGTIRLKLLKIGALVRISVRRIKVAMASACPWQNEFALAHVAIAKRRRLTRTRHRTVNIHPINAAGLAVLLMRDPTLAIDIRSSVLPIPRLFAPRAVLHPSPV